MAAAAIAAPKPVPIASLPTDLPGSRPQDDRKTTLLEENQGQLKMT